MTIYWYHWLRCAPLQSLKRLAKQGALPKCIEWIQKPLYASCVFAAAHRRRWRTKGRKQSHIKKPSQTNLLDGTSCDHMISHQLGLIPQTTGRLTHEQFWVADYQRFLAQNFDGTANNLSPIAQPYFSSQANNEVYTLREMLLINV